MNSMHTSNKKYIIALKNFCITIANKLIYKQNTAKNPPASNDHRGPTKTILIKEHELKYALLIKFI